MGEQFKVSLINMAHTALTHRMKLSPPEATPPVWCGICLCAEVKEEKKKWPRGIYGGKTTSATTEWVSSLWLLNKWVKRHQKEQLWKKQEGIEQGFWCQTCRPRYKPALLLNSYECSAIDFSTLCLSFSICETGVIKVPTTHGYLRVKWGMQISYTVPATQ